MNAQKIMEQLLQSARDLAEKGKTAAEQQLGVAGKEGAERDAMMSGLGKGAAVGGLLALLLGTKFGRRLGGKALKYGTLAALGTVAYKAYQNYQQSSGAAEEEIGTQIGELSEEAAERRSMTLLKAMIAAAKADGHVDDKEREAIQTQMQQLKLSDDELYFVHAELEQGVTPTTLAREVDSKAAAAEVYLASRMIIDVDHPDERAYLESLATELGLSQELVDQLEAEA